MDLKAYSFIWLSVSDYPSLYPQITTFLFKISENWLLPVQTGSGRAERNSINSGDLTGLYNPSWDFKSANIDFLLAWNR